MAQAAPTTLNAALRGLCPRCGATGLFPGVARFAERCPACGLDFTQFNVGDGPAAFLILIVGAIVMVAAMWLELAVGPPFWVHIILWVPIALGLTILLLRIGKAALLAIEYKNRAREGRIVE